MVRGKDRTDRGPGEIPVEEQILRTIAGVKGTAFLRRSGRDGGI